MTARYHSVGVSRDTSCRRPFQCLRKGVMYALLLSLAGCETCEPTATQPPIDQDLTVTVGPTLNDIAQGSAGTYTVTVQRSGVTGPVALDLFSVLPGGASITFNPTTLPTGVSSAVVTITLANDAAIKFFGGTPQPENVIIRAKSGDLVRYGQFTFRPTLSSAAGFTMNVTPAALNVRPGQFVDGTVLIARQGNYKGAINLGIRNLPNGITATTTLIAGQPDTYRLRVEASASAQPSATKETFRIEADAEGLGGKLFDVAVTVINASFAPRTVREPRMRAGDLDTVTVLLGRGVGFTAPITMSVDNAPAGVTGTFAVNPVVDDAVLFTLRTTASVPAGRHTVQIRGVPQAGSGAIEQTHVINFTVDPPLASNAYVLVPPNVSVVAGSNTSSIFSVNRSSGFAEPVTVTLARAGGAALPAGLTVSLDQNPITLSATTMRVNTTAATPTGTYTFVATGIALNAINVTANFNIVVTALPIVTSVTIGKLVNGTPQPTTSETIASTGSVSLTAVVLDQNSQPMSSEGVNWSSPNTSVVTVSSTGEVTGVAPGLAAITATSKTNAAIRASVAIVVIAPPTTTVARIELEPGNAEITAPATQQYIVALFDATGARVTAEAGTTFEYSSSNTSKATVNAASGLVTGVASGSVTITVRYLRNGVMLRQATAPLFVYAPGSPGHYGSAYISTNSNNTRTVRAGQALLFQLFVFDVNGVQKPTGITPAPTITSSNTSVITIAPSSITGGYFYTMNVAGGAVVGTTVTIRYDLAGAGGEIIMTIVP